ncbi:MAG: hypothetical protein HFG37_07180 [Eubacterium sp.]|nr:hypothetical protein [Eubacterium sp.]
MNLQRKYKFKRKAAFLLIAALLAGILPMPGSSPVQAAGYGVSSPRIDSSDITTWDCIWFGNYWQEDTNGDGKADKNDAKIPIKWRVLSVEGDDAFLVADKNLDCRKYNDTNTDVTWETCTLRSWLNGYGAETNVCKKDYSSENFIDYAFTPEEKAAIQTTYVMNKSSLDYETEGGNNTTDQLYLLSLDEVTDSTYGFTSRRIVYAESRRALNTAFAKGKGASTSESGEYAGNGCWWLRSPGNGSDHASSMDYDGYVNSRGYDVDIYSKTVRPALHLNLSSVSSWSYAGTVTSDGKKEEPATPTPSPQTTEKPETPAPTPQTTSEPETTPSPQITYDLKVNTSGAGAVTLKTSKTTVSTDGNASIEMKVECGEDVLLTFQPAEESGPYTVTIDGEEKQAEENTYRIPSIQSSHTVLVTFTEKLQPTPEPTPPPSPTPTPTSTPEPPGPTETPVPTEDPSPSATPVSTGTPAPSLAPEPIPSQEPVPSQKPTPSPVPTPEASQTPLPDKDLTDITDGLGVSPDTAVKIQTAAKELDVSMDTILVTEQTIRSQKTDQDIKGAYFARIQARASQITEKNIKLAWNRVKGADGYEVYGNRCNTKKWIYEYKRKNTIKNGVKKSYIDRKCKKGTYYKYMVRAYKIIDGKKVTIAVSKTIHVTTRGGKNGNAKSVKLNKNKVTLKAGRTWRIKAKEIKESKPLRHHREVSYESSRPQTASVSKKGVIKAKKKGKCTIFAYAQSGVYRKVQITVK